MLILNDVHTAYGPIEVLKGVSLEVKPGEIVTIIGANGAGKTTTLMAISGINHLKQGTITFTGERIDNLPAHEIVAKGIVQIPEGRRIFPRLTVLENLQMGAFIRNDDTSSDIDRAFKLFPILKERAAQKGGTLSGGEQQMLAIARALMARPKLLMLDEPSLGLAPIIVTRIFDAIKELNQSGTTILLVEQNARMALQIASRGYVLELGRVALSDTAQNLLNNPKVKEAYLGG
ncbi:MAG: ABC transporter ATP-binding protein [Planctomycetes bacterium]|nr:ABC transporter ATP-binding protein [Planctomycetota bacterium]